MIKKVIIHNFKKFRDFQLDLDDGLNILVGDNETGKSTILEAINIALTKKLNGNYLENEISPYLFNSEVSQQYLEDIKNDKNPELPNIIIELYLKEDIPEFAKFRGTNNSLKEDSIGIRVVIEFDRDFSSEYENLIQLKDQDEIKLVPTEFYKVSWKSFADAHISFRSIPLGISFIDTTSIRLQNGTDYYIQHIIRNGLDVKERVSLSIAYRKLKEIFSSEDSITQINRGLDNSKGDITDKELSIEMDVSQRTNWETSLVPHLDHLPFQFSGKGEQNSLKIMLALFRDSDKSNIILIEEPENHLSYSSMNGLLYRINEKLSSKQIIITTHSSYVLNKLGLEKLILLSSGSATRLKDLDPETQNYFKKLSGYDTLRIILAKKSILVEGPSDELIVQKAYRDITGKLPIEDGIDVINVRGLSFKRFLNIAKLLPISISVVTDNDGNYEENIIQKYSSYSALENINICADSNNSLVTLEPQIVECNDLKTLNTIFGSSYSNKEELIAYMQRNKTDCALMLFQTDVSFNIPQYIKDAFQ